MILTVCVVRAQKGGWEQKLDLCSQVLENLCAFLSDTWVSTADLKIC